ESEHGATVPNVAVGSTVVVTNAQGQTVLSGVFNSASSVMTPKANDIDDTNYFVSQQYRDFLDREADDNGLDFWKGEIERCGGDDACRQRTPAAQRPNATIWSRACASAARRARPFSERWPTTPSSSRRRRTAPSS